MWSKMKLPEERRHEAPSLRETARFDLQSVRNPRRALACVARDLP